MLYDIEPKIVLFGLLLGCSLPTERECPLKKYRLLPIEERLEWARSLADDEVKKILEYHTKCYNTL